MNKVLVVDDEVLVRTNLKMLVTATGLNVYVCGEASNGAEAMELMDKLSPDIVITDMKMPVMDGLTLTGRLKEAHARVAAIALSNYDDYDFVRGALKNGAVDYILKHNLNHENLSEALKKALDTISEKQSGEQKENA